MPAPKGNRFWELRSKHGRDKIFASPELLWKEACKYFEWCIDNPLEEEEIVKGRTEVTNPEGHKELKNFERVHVNKMRPFTIQGLTNYLDINKNYFDEFEEGLRGKSDDLSKGFSGTISRIRATIFQQKFEGAASGFFNANLIARELQIKDEIHTTNTNLNSKLSRDERKKRIKELERRRGK